MSSDQDREAAGHLTDEQRSQELTAQLEALAKRLRAQAPEFEPAPFSRQRLLALVGRVTQGLAPEQRAAILERLGRVLDQDLFDAALWRGAWYVLNYTVMYYVDVVRRHGAGDFVTDQWGLDWELVDAVRPFISFLYRVYWRVEVTGLENIPAAGRALLVSNHSGLLPWDGFMVGAAILMDHPAQRLVRGLYAELLARMPVVSTLLVRLGQTLATVENGTRLLEEEELVVVFPEGYKGLGKVYRDRYKLARFGRGGFAKMALHTQAPVIPVSVVGAEEANPTLAKVPLPYKLTGIPYIPVTLTFPWLGLLGFLPLPTKWYIDFGQPVQTAGYDPHAADHLVLVSQVSDHVRNKIQDMIDSRLAQRHSIFFG